MDDKTIKTRTRNSYIMYIVSLMIFSSVGIVRRFIPLSSAFTSCLRGFSGSLFLYVFVKLRKIKLFENIEKKNLILLIISGALMGLNWTMLFEGFKRTSVAVATLCYYMEPTIVIIASAVIFKEKLSKKNIICAAVSLTGMVFVSGIIGGTNINFSDMSGILFSLSAAFLYSSVLIINTRIHIDGFYDKTIIQLFTAGAVLLVYILMAEGIPNIKLSAFESCMLGIICFVHTGIAYALYFGSLNNLKTKSVAILSYLDPIATLILSAVFLNEYLSGLGVLGAVLIIGAALINEIDLPKPEKISK